MLKLYGTSKSRSARCLWALEELGLKYEHIPVEVAKAQSPENLKLNPNGHIPVLDDDGEIFWESMAINLYLAAKYGKAPMWPESHEGRGHAVKWSFLGHDRDRAAPDNDPTQPDAAAARATQRAGGGAGGRGDAGAAEGARRGAQGT